MSAATQEQFLVSIDHSAGCRTSMRIGSEAKADRLVAAVFRRGEAVSAELRRDGELLRSYRRTPRVAHEPCPVPCCGGQLEEVALWGERAVVLRCSRCDVVSSALRRPS